jgi:hypothetical protein
MEAGTFFMLFFTTPKPSACVLIPMT